MSTYATLMFARREIARYLNVWGQTVVPPIVMAALFLFVFGHALGSRIGSFGGVEYLAFIAPGLVAQGALQNSYNNTSSSFFDSRRARYVEDVLQSPLLDWQIILAHTLAGTSRGILIGLGSLAIAWPVTTGWQVDWVLFPIILVIGCACFALIGLIAGLYASRWDHIFVPVTFILTPLTFLGGVFYPVSALPGDLALLSRFNPILYIVDALRATTLGVHDLPVMPTVVGLIILDIALFAALVRLFATSGKLRA